MMRYGDWIEMFEVKGYGDDNKNAVKLAIMHCLHVLLLGLNNQKVINLDLLHLADDLSCLMNIHEVFSFRT